MKKYRGSDFDSKFKSHNYKRINLLIFNQREKKFNKVAKKFAVYDLKSNNKLILILTQIIVNNFYVEVLRVLMLRLSIQQKN